MKTKRSRGEVSPLFSTDGYPISSPRRSYFSQDLHCSPVPCTPSHLHPLHYDSNPECLPSMSHIVYTSSSSTTFVPSSSFLSSHTLDFHTCYVPLAYFLHILRFLLFYFPPSPPVVHPSASGSSRTGLLGSKSRITNRMYIMYCWLYGNYKTIG